MTTPARIYIETEIAHTWHIDKFSDALVEYVRADLCTVVNLGQIPTPEEIDALIERAGLSEAVTVYGSAIEVDTHERIMVNGVEQYADGYTVLQALIAVAIAEAKGDEMMETRTLGRTSIDVGTTFRFVYGESTPSIIATINRIALGGDGSIMIYFDSGFQEPVSGEDLAYAIRSNQAQIITD